LKGTFFADLIAWIPYDYMFFRDEMHTSDVKLLRLSKLLRIPKMLVLLDNEKFKSKMSEIYGRQLRKAVILDDFNYHYPIMKHLYYVYFYRILETIVIVLSCSYLLAIFWRIWISVCVDWENNDEIDVFNGYETWYTYYGFVDENGVHMDDVK
jgi:hypothetical protein